MPTPHLLTARLKAGRDKLLLQGHPWVFRSAIARLDGERLTGAQVDVRASDGAWRGRGIYHAEAELAIRIYTRQPGEAVDAQLVRDRLDQAGRLRELLPAGEAGDTDAGRLVYSEGDGLSGLIVDRYADTLSIQVHARAMAPFLGDITRFLLARTGATHVVIHADAEAVRREGLDAAALAAGSRPPPGPTRIRQDGLWFEVDARAGQKTGFYLDQRNNRRRVAEYAKGRNVLSAYCYTGAFEVYAARAGAARVTGIDSSEPALAQARAHLALNGLATPATYLAGDVPAVLRQFRDAGQSFDLIILDPPRFVASNAQKTRGLRAYKDINLLAMKLLQPGGVLATFSCSGLVSREDFLTVVKWAATDSRRSFQILEFLSQPPDHPVLPAFQEGHYLKGLIGIVGR
jgi:23S rRNA (cytosine1962-C5)-methyltransferase